ncbi:hypothetical protein QJS10_CPA09g01026 [Acorus calamus]|uniref:Uncharacterized protein n=1 Tax=Acorus calamus TaxID=4465 RepID=A0AAV9E3B1_ACOCL|nr:hypothetical protein QJS10_CPA09g01026 [Acorus calamus]
MGCVALSSIHTMNWIINVPLINICEKVQRGNSDAPMLMSRSRCPVEDEPMKMHRREDQECREDWRSPDRETTFGD